MVTREAVLAEGVKGGYAATYGVLKVLEERGQVRRGYFVAGLGAAQFALPGAVDRLRSAREVADPSCTPSWSPPRWCSSATDPAQPYGAALDWPESPGRASRTAGAVVVLRSGVPLAWFDRRSSHLVTFPDVGRRQLGRGAGDAGEGRPAAIDRGSQGQRRTDRAQGQRSAGAAGRRLRRGIPRFHAARHMIRPCRFM